MGDRLRRVFPWGDEPGISAVLDTPDLWAGLLPESNLRQAVKRVASKFHFRKEGQIVRVDDDSAIGQLVIKILESPSGREGLAREFTKCFGHDAPLQEFGYCLFRSYQNSLTELGLLHDSPESACTGDPDEPGSEQGSAMASGLLVKRDGVMHVDAKAVENWLRGVSPAEAGWDTLGRFCCALALWCPEDRDQLAVAIERSAPILCSGLFRADVDLVDSPYPEQRERIGNADPLETRISSGRPVEVWLKDLAADISSMELEARLLAEAIAVHTKRLEEGCVTVPEELVSQWAKLQERFQQVCRCLADRAEKEGLSQMSTEIADLGTLRTAYETVVDGRNRTSVRENKDLASRILNRVMTIVHESEPEYEPLKYVRQAAEELRHELAASERELGDDARRLVEGAHALSMLLEWVENATEIDDERWALIDEVIRKQWGRDICLAATRGRLVLRDGGGSPEVAGGQVMVAAGPESEMEDRAKHVDQPVRDASVQTDRPARSEVMSTSGGPVRVRKLTPDEFGVSGSDEGLKPLLREEFSETVIAEPGALASDPVSAKSRETGRMEMVEPSPPPMDSVPAAVAVPKTSTELAAAALGADQTERLALLSTLVWQALAEDDAATAYHVAKIVRPLPGGPAMLPPWLVRAVALGRRLRHPAGTYALELEKAFQQFDVAMFHPSANDVGWNHAVRFVLAAAALRPSVVDPGTGAPAILKALHFKEGLENLHKYRSRLLEHGERGQPLDPSVLKVARTRASWDADIKAMVSKATAWVSEAAQSSNVYAPATRVWRLWLEADGLIGDVVRPVCENDTSQLGRVREAVGRIRDRDFMKAEVKRADPRRRRGAKEIEARALNHLVTQAGKAASLVQDWIDLHGQAPGHVQNYLQNEAASLRAALRDLHTPVAQELEKFARNSNSAIVRAGATICKRAVEDLSGLFDPEVSLEVDEPPERFLLNNVVLAAPKVRLDAEWCPDGVPEEVVLDEVLRVKSSGPINFRRVFEQRNNLHDHAATDAVIEYLGFLREPQGVLEELRESRRKDLESSAMLVRRQADVVEREVGAAVALGLLREAERVELVGEIEDVRRLASIEHRFPQMTHRLDEVSGRIKAKRASEIKVVEERLQSVGNSFSDEGRARVGSAIEKGDVLAATEYIDNLLVGRELPSTEIPRDEFPAFFPEEFKRIWEFLESGEGADTNRLVRELRRRAKGGGSGRIGPIDIRQVGGKQIEESANLIEAWYTLKRSRRSSGDHLKSIFRLLGFDHPRAQVAPSGARGWAQVEAGELRDREICPVPQFGSSAKGRYRVLCVWDRPSEEDLVNRVGDTTQPTPVIVFYLGRMSEKVRRGLAATCRRRRRTFLVLDDVVLWHLTTARGARLSLLFQCLLPFTFLEPYSTTAGLVPPELFYGRRRERAEIIDSMGSCFIYGGRQLGKTALLREVERTFDEPENGRVAIWIDLKTHGIGFNRSIDEFWDILGRELKQREIVPKSMPGSASAEVLLGHVKNWLGEDGHRRLLLLLDEADRFLEQDGCRAGAAGESGGEFVRTARLKGLMDETERRFKVVFAGLHNVQRTTRLENQPLAHYGEPMCIGPLIDDGEWREAQELVLRPLGSIGYRFESSDLVTRVLSQTNYYPSLIQLYCNFLLRHVQRIEYNLKECPPYQITSQHVEDAYQDQKLRSAIRDRFMWTLDLDPRYRLIAFALALDSLGAHDISGGFSVREIREEAIAYWREGFEDLESEDAFRVLLEEMAGLGVVREVSGGCYALRSLSVVSLLGNEEQIEGELESSSRREAAPEYEPAQFRSAYRGDSGEVNPGRRNPLTAQQEAELRASKSGVSIVFGCSAAGLKDVHDFLGQAVGRESVKAFSGAFDARGFSRWLDEAQPRDLAGGGVTIALVPSTVPWDRIWFQEAEGKVRRLKSKKSFLRVLFLGDSATAWRLGDEDRTLSSRLSLTRWGDVALRQWLDDCGFGSVERDERERITIATGNWPLFLSDLRGRCGSDLHLWTSHLAELERHIETSAKEILKESFGIDRDDVRALLADLSEWGEATNDDLCELGHRPDLVARTLSWADSLGFVKLVGADRWKLDRFVGRLLLIPQHEPSGA